MEPPPLLADDPAAADPARLRLARKKSLFSFPSTPALLRSKKHADTDDTPPPSPTPARSVNTFIRNRANTLSSRAETETIDPDAQPFAIDLDDSSLTDSGTGEDKDVYRWAVVYENQRGITLFSTAYYSPLSLLPHDPPPFTIPEADGRGDRQPQVSLTDFPLPDGTWRWVSNAWMIDMRDEGEVQFDGFEYNWFFRRYKWRAQVGTASAGGWVRRRRWIRLMMRPARNSPDPNLLTNGATPAADSQPSSSSGSSALDLEVDEKDVWKGDEGDWRRCRLLMRQLITDGKKLEVWKDWLGIQPPQDSKGKKKQWTEDDYSLASEVAHEMLSTNWRPIHAKPPAEYISKIH
ncbi:hypothetical protein FA95DRAFT_1605785 [Auriscalpium vulgare]|uniref:Uncharacterized protein n=1 Tax=Auriscalpium vulgare TaxID=40419 RepID=A0ACB8RV80_9AGAM|nr:hypothetical protein FA95DRAFT_1605785 [Auriscalpium vulgare]